MFLNIVKILRDFRRLKVVILATFPLRQLFGVFLWFSRVVGMYLRQPTYWDAIWDVLRVFETFHLNQKGNTKKDDILEQAFISSLIN